ncbi:dihydrofolate reductase family protein [Sphingomonas sp. DG1-23]|uniref:dihydrofolate reductase family protein n=1 Tax=Sphingomonas sp. DG1-23 TaxID=3068316 RepID=UPI00273DBDCA|nr:dihydrofolate reductase family protein [Sphingomonas sp. DG1-23]MDP5279770.1 dihydrofolate reductase family protein [Sphingomonas sp. DG1-23]
MTTVRVSAFSISTDGFGAGVEQGLDNPLGRRGEELHHWAFGTRTFRGMFGEEGGSDGVDESYAARSMAGLGAWIMGRNMFGPVRGAWPDDSWKGWWGDNPPYHVPVFVLTHHARPPIEMEGGTVFHFVTDGIESALAQARAAAGERDIRIGGGVATIREYLAAQLLDTLHLAVAPVLLGQGEALFHGLDLNALGYHVAEQVAGENAVHLTIARRA